MHLFKLFGNGSKHSWEELDVTEYEHIFEDKTQSIKYKKLTQEMNLYQNYLDLIQKNQLDSQSRTTLKTIQENAKYSLSHTNIKSK